MGYLQYGPKTDESQTMEPRVNVRKPKIIQKDPIKRMKRSLEAVTSLLCATQFTVRPRSSITWTQTSDGGPS